MTSKKSKAEPKKKKAKTKKKTSTAKKSTKTDNRGSGERIPVQLLVDYKCDGNYLFDFCKDLGTGGVFIQTDSPRKQGDKMDLVFTIPDSKETLSATGNVMWVQAPVEGRQDLTPGMGIQFDGFDPESRKSLEDFLDRHNSSEKKSA